MVSAVPLCLFAIAITVVSSQTPTPTDLESVLEDQTPIAERRTFKHKKNVKFIPFLKKHKKFGGWLPHVFNKAEYAEVPIIHEPIVRPAWKVHRYQGIELKPIEVPEPYVETHAFEHDLPPPPPSNVLFYTEKPVFQPLAPLPPPTQFVFPSLPAPLPAPAIFPAPLPPKTILPFLPPPPPQAPVLPTIPLKVAPPQPAIFTVSIPQSPLPAVAPSPVPALPPPVPAEIPAPVKISQPILPPVSTPAPPPAFSSVTIAPPPAPVLPSLPVKIPQPILPPISTPAPPVFSHVTVSPPPPLPIFPSIPTTFQSPPVIPSFPALPSVAAPEPFAAVPEPEFPYPPSDTPIPSYIKHDSLHDTSVIDTPLKVEHPEVEIEDHVKTPEHAVEIVKPDTGLLHKLKGWKAEKAQAALNHFSHFKAKPVIHHPLPISHPDKIPLPIPVTTIAPPHPTAFSIPRFPPPIRPFPLAPAAPVYFPSTPKPISHLKYESFPPNNVELPPPPPPPLFNSYGVPIPHDSYAPINRDSNEGLASSASEEEPSVVPPPPAFGEQRNQPQRDQQSEDAIQNFQPQLILSQKSPIYVPEENQTVKEDVKTSQETQPLSSANSSVNSDSEDNYQQPQEETQGEETDANLNNHRTY